MSRRALFLSALFLLSACNKVPLREDRGSFDVAAAHWFENEKTEYVFFSISGLRPAQARLSWPSGIEISIAGLAAPVPGLNVKADGFAPLNLSAGVHRHHLVECGSGRLCGSFSFHADTPASSVSLRYRYNLGSPMLESTTMTTSVHPDSGTADAQSALVYGVFNGDNSRVRVMVHDNFGTPDSGQIVQYGMERAFRVDGLQLTDLTAADEAQASQASGSSFLFPAQPCSAKLVNASGSFLFRGLSSWAPNVFDPQDTRGTACFYLRLLDAKGNELHNAPAMARANPVLGQEPLTLQPPLKDAHRIPIVISYCPGRPESASLVSADFLDYQRFILGFPNAPVDVCFFSGQEGDEARFQADLDRVLQQKLIAARQNSTDDGDFFFVVAINQRLPAVIKTYHQMIADHLSTLIGGEVLKVSPRLVGALVYDSQSASTRPINPGNNVTWCPRDVQDSTGTGASCNPVGSNNISLGPLTVLMPMGPFPTMDVFLDNLQRNGNRGRSVNPQLSVRAVHTNTNSISGGTVPQPNLLYTFFDGQRLSLATGERLKFCRERDPGQMLSQMAYRYTDATGNSSVLTTDDAQTLTLGGAEGPTLDVGMWWESPYIAGFSFDIPLQGSIFGVIPLQKTFGSTQRFGDEIWRQTTWDLTPLMQKCLRNCAHPYFDEAGSYQINQTWVQAPTCLTPKIPEPGA